MYDSRNGCVSVAGFLGGPNRETTVFVLLVLLGYELERVCTLLGRKSLVYMICRCSVNAEVAREDESSILKAAIS